MPGIVPAMRQIKALAVLFALLPGIAAAQQILPKNTVLGRLGVPSNGGPAQAIPFAVLFQTLGTATGPQSCATHNWFNSLNGAGTFGCAQPAVGDISGFGTGVATALGDNVNTAGGFITSPAPYANLPAGTSDTVIGFWGSTVASALAINNCTNSLTYSTSSHAFGCNSIAGTGTVTTTGSPTSGQRAVMSGATSITGVTALAPKVCDIISTSATTCNNGGSVPGGGNGNYTSTSGALYTVFELVGGGSGGSGSGSSGNTAGASGTQTTVNSTTTAPGASAPATTAAGAVGGVAGANCDFTVAGANGQTPDSTIATPPGAQGASSFFAGGGVPGIPGAQTGGAAPANSGAGGGGGGPGSGVPPASAGAAGAYCRKTFAAGTYAYTVGPGGGGGGIGTSGGAGGAAGGGRIIATDYFQ